MATRIQNPMADALADDDESPEIVVIGDTQGQKKKKKKKKKGATEPDAIRPAPAVHEHLAAVLIQAHIRGNRDRKHYDFFRHREDTKIQAGGGQCQYCHNCCPAHVNLLCVSWLSGVVELRRYSIASLRQAQRSTGSKADAKR